MSASLVNMSSSVRRGLMAAYRCLSSARTLPGIGGRVQAFSSSPSDQFSPPVESTEEYCHVERLIPPSCVPTPPKHTGPTPSGWTPPPDVPPSLPYMVRRSRMHNIPVYSDITHGNRHMTLALEQEVKQHLAKLTGKSPPTQVNEVTGSIRVKGQFDKELKAWLVKKGF
ncbi:large ribosomal subunit protein mL49 isoform X2 [Amia ocellicauda]|uniref:large ribosomal subunit protein mL49 isoform X2 n=1 Tax=Amia ocellicauda TaxID=2972642 RepID=UPI0034647D25